MTGTAAMPWSADDRIALWGWGREGRAAWRAIRSRLPTLPLTLFCQPGEADDLPGVHQRHPDRAVGAGGQCVRPTGNRNVEDAHASVTRPSSSGPASRR